MVSAQRRADDAPAQLSSAAPARDGPGQPWVSPLDLGTLDLRSSPWRVSVSLLGLILSAGPLLT